MLVFILTVTTAKEDEMKYRTYYEGKWNPQVMIKWIKEHGLDPHEMFQALHLLKNEPIKFASETIMRNFRLQPIHIEMMLKALDLNVVDAYEALFAWEEDHAVTEAYKAVFNDMSPNQAQAQMKGEEVFTSFEEEMENNYVPEIIKRLIKLYRNESWYDFNIKAHELKLKVIRRKQFLKNYEPVQKLRKENPQVFRAIRRFMLKGHTVGPNVTVPTISRKLRHQDCRDLHDIRYNDDLRYHLLQNETTFAQSSKLRQFEKLPAARIRNIKRYYDSVNNVIIECEKIIRHRVLDDGSSRKVETKTRFIYANDNRFFMYLNTSSTPPSFT